MSTLPTTIVCWGNEREIDWIECDLGSYFDLETGPSEFDYRFLVRPDGTVKFGPINPHDPAAPISRWHCMDGLPHALMQFGWRIA